MSLINTVNDNYYYKLVSVVVVAIMVVIHNDKK